MYNITAKRADADSAPIRIDGVKNDDRADQLVRNLVHEGYAVTIVESRPKPCVVKFSELESGTHHYRVSYAGDPEDVPDISMAKPMADSNLTNEIIDNCLRAVEEAHKPTSRDIIKKQIDLLRGWNNKNFSYDIEQTRKNTETIAHIIREFNL